MGPGVGLPGGGVTGVALAASHGVNNLAGVELDLPVTASSSLNLKL